MGKKTEGIDAGKILEDIVSTAISSLVAAGEMPASRLTVTDCGAHVLYAALGEYMEGTSKLAAEVDALFEALKNSEDAVVQSMGALNRQMLWGTLNLLRKEKERRHALAAKSTQVEVEEDSRQLKLDGINGSGPGGDGI